MSDAKYLGLTANNLAKIATNLERENAKLRKAIAKAVRVQTVLCADKDAPWCRNECQLHRAESDDCEACDVLEVAQALGIEVGA